jgi:hypothetical protein
MFENHRKGRAMNESQYMYKGQNLTTLILSKLEHIIGLLAEQEGRAFDDCYVDFVSSKTYQNLINTNTLLWSESAEFILDDYNCEIVANSRTLLSIDFKKCF